MHAIKLFSRDSSGYGIYMAVSTAWPGFNGGAYVPNALLWSF